MSLTVASCLPCFSVSGEVPQEPVISVKTGHLFERRLIEKYLKVGNKCPISGVELAETDLLSVQGEERTIDWQLSSCHYYFFSTETTL